MQITACVPSKQRPSVVVTDTASSRCSTSDTRASNCSSQPRARKASSTISAMSRSSFGSTWGRADSSVTRTPHERKNSAYSQPVAPAPTTTRLSGSRRRVSTSRGVNTRAWSTCANGGSQGAAPVASSSRS